MDLGGSQPNTDNNNTRLKRSRITDELEPRFLAPEDYKGKTQRLKNRRRGKDRRKPERLSEYLRSKGRTEHKEQETTC